MLAGQGIDYPHITGANVTHRRAGRAAAAKPEELELFGRAAEAPEDYDSEESPRDGPGKPVGDRPFALGVLERPCSIDRCSFARGSYDIGVTAPESTPFRQAILAIVLRTSQFA